jgi:hypothetical protein
MLHLPSQFPFLPLGSLNTSVNASSCHQYIQWVQNKKLKIIRDSLSAPGKKNGEQDDSEEDHVNERWQVSADPVTTKHVQPLEPRARRTFQLAQSLILTSTCM